MLDAALAYAERGYHVFPLEPGSKAPREGSSGFHDATTDADTIRAWWGACPDANIGIACAASGIVAIDVDVPGPDHSSDGRPTITALADELGPLPETCEAVTGTGGTHLLFAAPAGVDFRGNLGPGVDLKHNGYIVVWPSVREGGAEYRWIGSPLHKAPAPLPTAWLARTAKPAPKAATGPEVASRAAGSTAYGCAAFDAELARVRTAPKGERNNTLNEVAFKLGALYAGGEISDVREDLAIVALYAGLSEGEARKTVESGWRAGMQTPRSAPPREAWPVDSAPTRMPEAKPPRPLTVDEESQRQSQIVISTDESAVIDAAIAVLGQAREVYVRGSEIVEVVTDAPTTPGVIRSGPFVRIHRSPEPRIRELLARGAQWLAPRSKGSPTADHPPLWAVRGVMARGTWPALRPLSGVSEAPTMRPDGTILSEPGYDPATGIYLAGDLRIAMPDRPTHEHAVAAAIAISDVIAEFPVASEAGRSAWLAGVITAAARPAIDGPAPMTIVDASVPGAGKTLMADAAAMIVTGRPAARTTYVTDDGEMRKRITALALVGDPVALLDNVVGTLGCPSLDAALTGTTWRDRLLGVSVMTPELPLRIGWWATGNGLVIGADLIRRALLVRLEPMVERPEERAGWRHPHLLDHVREHRAALLGAALTIARAYVVAGRPDQGLTPMGSYTDWSDLVRSALVWTGLPDPCATVAEIRACDPRTDALRGIVQSWPAGPNVPIAVTHLLEKAEPASEWRAALCEWCPPRGGEPLPSARSLGNRLRGVRCRVVGDRYLDAGPRVASGATWVLHGVRS